MWRGDQIVIFLNAGDEEIEITADLEEIIRALPEKSSPSCSRAALLLARATSKLPTILSL